MNTLEINKATAKMAKTVRIELESSVDEKFSADFSDDSVGITGVTEEVETLNFEVGDRSS